MRQFPIFLALEGSRVAVVGGGAAALAKLRLLLRTPARITVYAADPSPRIRDWAAQGRLFLALHRFSADEAKDAALIYAASEDPGENVDAIALAHAAGTLLNVVDDPVASNFLTPAIVDRAPLTVAIGSEGAAPVLARVLKADLEARLSPRLGALARAAQTFRTRARALAPGRARRAFWTAFFTTDGPRAAETGEDALAPALNALLARHLERRAAPGRVEIVGAGPGDPELLTLKARKALDLADVVIHGRRISTEILDLARREARMIILDEPFAARSASAATTRAEMIASAREGAHVVWLLAGNPTAATQIIEVGRALTRAGVAWSMVPGIALPAGQAMRQRRKTDPRLDRADLSSLDIGLAPRVLREAFTSPPRKELLQ